MNGAWRKATRSTGNGGSCVEVRQVDAVIEVRDSKAHGAGPTLHFTKAGFAAFISALRRGDFSPVM